MRAPRCYLVYAVASEGISASDANDLLNDYVADRQRGIAVFHDHFTAAEEPDPRFWWRKRK